MLSFERNGESQQAATQIAAQNNTTPQNPAVQQAVQRYIMKARGARISQFSADARRTLLALVILWFAVFAYFARRVPAWVLGMLIALLVLFDLWGVGKRHLGDDAYTDKSTAEHVGTYGFDRYVLDRVEAAGGPGHFRTFSLEQDPTQWARPAYHYEISSGYNAAKLRLYQDLLDNFSLGNQGTPPSKTFLDITGTRLVVARHSFPDMTIAFQDKSGMLVLERNNPRARTTLVGDFVVVSTSSSISVLTGPDFDSTTMATVGSDPGIPTVEIDSSSIAVVRLVEYDAHTAVWAVETDVPRLLVTSEVYYPAGWTASVNGVEVPILRTNHAFRAVVVPAGESTVSMKFAPRSHTLGRTISAGATGVVYGVLILFLFIEIRRRRGAVSVKVGR